MKNSLKISNLAKNPELREQSIKLIESAFGYDSKNSFAIDFYPLVCNENNHNCYIIIESNTVIAHIGVLPKKLQLGSNIIDINFYGGIAVAEQARGKGIFQTLFNHVVDKYDNCHLHLLWSDKIKMYKKFFFYPAISQYEFSHQGNASKEYIKTHIELLSSEEKKQIQLLYQNDSNNNILRTEDDWQRISRITSADFYIKKHNEKIIDYFVMNKGADLKGVIHEHYQLDEKKLNLLRGHGKVWSSKPIGNVSSTLLYASLVRIGKKFNEFVKALTQDQIHIIKYSNEGVDFCFQSKDYFMPTEEFIVGLLGPGSFEELNNLASIYICGLDSI